MEQLILLQTRKMIMKFLFFILSVFFMIDIISANDFTWQFLENPSLKLSKNLLTALFDREENFNTGRIIWDASTAPTGCGLLIYFSNPTAISKVIVTTAKPNALSYTPDKTEFYSWDSNKQSWRKPVVIQDITGKAKDKKFTAASIRTVWNLPEAITTESLKILMYGSGVWLTEVQVYDQSGRLLVPEKKAVPSVNPVLLKPFAHGGGATANIGFYNTKLSFIGNPNALNRCDRVLIQFDLRNYLETGKISQGILTLALSGMGNLDANLLNLEVFSLEHTPLRNMDLIANDIVPCGKILYDAKSVRYHSFDVTEFLNDALARGDGTITFRIRNGTVEKVGNRYSKAEGALIDYKQTKLEIVK